MIVLHRYFIWNKLVPLDNKEINVKAISCDIVFSTNGYLFLVQRKNGYNNIVCFSLPYRKCKGHTFLKALYDVYFVFKVFNIEYFRVEGNKRRYWFLAMLKHKLIENIVRDSSIENRNVFYGRIL